MYKMKKTTKAQTISWLVHDKGIEVTIITLPTAPKTIVASEHP